MTLTVNGKKIDDSLIKQEAERLRPAYEKTFANMPPDQREAQLLDWSRENVIETTLLNQHAEKYGQPVKPAEIQAAFDQLKKDYGGKENLHKQLGTTDDGKIKQTLELQIKVQQLLTDLCKNIPSPSKEDISNFYSQNKQQFQSPEKIRVSHIVKHIDFQTDENSARNTIKKAQQELKNGATFEALVEKYSDCPENGGDLGYIPKRQMVEEFDDVVFNLAPGQISDTFRTRFGFHLAKVYDRKPADLKSLDQVADHIKNQLKDQTQKDAVDEFVDRLKAAAKIEKT